MKISLENLYVNIAASRVNHNFKRFEIEKGGLILMMIMVMIMIMIMMTMMIMRMKTICDVINKSRIKVKVVLIM